MTRKHSIQPFTKGLPSGEIVDCLTQILRADPGASTGLGVIGGGGGGDGFGGGGKEEEAEAAATSTTTCETPRAITASSGRSAALVAAALRKARAAAVAGTLLRISFETLFEYLTYLKSIAGALDSFGCRAAFYLAAAVSDFYVPRSEMPEHKIQSSEVGGPASSDDNHLVLRLAKTPKMLGALREAWAPSAFVVGFKLETDEAILVSKAARSIASYGLHAVVANILETRKERVLIVAPPLPLPLSPPSEANGGEVKKSDAVVVDASTVRVTAIDRDPSQPFIERQLVAEIVRLHKEYEEKKKKEEDEEN